MSDGHLLRFLLVEDNADHAHLVQRSFQQARVANTLDHVWDGEQAIQYLKQTPPFDKITRPDILLLDLNLPKISGLEVLATIKQDNTLRNIPVVVLTTSDTDRDRSAAYSAGANSFLTKPVDFDVFCKMVADLNLYWGVWNQPPTDIPQRRAG